MSILEKKKQKSDGIKGKAISLPVDCWSVISNYFSRSSTFFNVMKTSKHFYDIFGSQHLIFCENLLFHLPSSIVADRYSTPDFDSILDGEKKCLFVRRLNISRTRKKIYNYRMERNKEMFDFFGKSQKEDTTKMEKILSKFPKLKELSLDTNSNFRSRMRFDASVFKFAPNIRILKIFLDSQDAGFFLENLFDTLSRNLKKLDHLEIKNSSRWPVKSVKSFGSLSSLSSLKTLKFDNVPFSDKCFKNNNGSTSSSVQHLSISNNLEKKDFCFSPSSSTFSSLRSLILRNIKVDKPNCLETISSSLLLKNKGTLTNLTLVGLNGGFSTSRSLLNNAINEIIHLKSLSLRDTDVVSGRIFSSCVRIKRLSVLKCPLFKAYDLCVQNLTESLIELNVDSRCINDSTLQKFQILEKLSVCGCNNLTPEGFKNFTTLKFLDIRKCYQEEFTVSFLSDIFSKNTHLENIQIYNDFIVHPYQINKKKKNILSRKKVLTLVDVDNNIGDYKYKKKKESFRGRSSSSYSGDDDDDFEFNPKHEIEEKRWKWIIKGKCVVEGEYEICDHVDGLFGGYDPGEEAEEEWRQRCEYEGGGMSEDEIDDFIEECRKDGTICKRLPEELIEPRKCSICNKYNCFKCSKFMKCEVREKCGDEKIKSLICWDCVDNSNSCCICKKVYCGKCAYPGRFSGLVDCGSRCERKFCNDSKECGDSSGDDGGLWSCRRCCF